MVCGIPQGGVLFSLYRGVVFWGCVWSGEGKNRDVLLSTSIVLATGEKEKVMGRLEDVEVGVW